jgi:glycosyltransferase involved in cell wall biosynthesis
MVFIGRKFNDNYKDPPKIHGPFKGVELANALRECDMYITASVYDACPMHVLEGLCCGLPMLYIDHEGGGKNICEFNDNKVGESFSNFTELLKGIETIRDNYEVYRNNIVKNMEMYGSDICYSRFMKVFMKEHLNIE